jgi:hypothetical protein
MILTRSYRFISLMQFFMFSYKQSTTGRELQFQIYSKYLTFCWPCIIMYHNNVTNTVNFYFHNHFYCVLNPLNVSFVKRPSSVGTTQAVFGVSCIHLQPANSKSVLRWLCYCVIQNNSEYSGGYKIANNKNRIQNTRKYDEVCFSHKTPFFQKITFNKYVNTVNCI